MSTERFKDADWFPVTDPILIVGVGGIGTYLSLALARMQPKALILYDMDEVDVNNTGTQLFHIGQVELPKVTAMKDTIKRFGGSRAAVMTTNGEYNGEFSKIMFSAVDNMSTRKQMFNTWKQRDQRELFIDGRIAAETLWVYAVEKGQEEAYEKYLLSDNELPDASCTMKATTHIGMLCAGFMVAQFTNYLTNRKLQEDVRPVMFRTEYQIPLGYVESTRFDQLYEEVATMSNNYELQT